MTRTDLTTHLAGLCTSRRILVAIAGGPASGKSTLADTLATDLIQHHTQQAQVVPMDGFHYDDSLLSHLGKQDRKGAPDTFDASGLAATLTRIAQGFQTCDVAVPVFDRQLEISRGAARIIRKQTRIVLVEGNYLLVNKPPWHVLAPLFDLTVQLDSDIDMLRARLMQRWLDHGYSQSDARAKIDHNDLPNARYTIDNSDDAQIALIPENR